MAEINAAYDLLRATAWTQRNETYAAPRRTPAGGRGAWLPPAIRRALGHELLSVVEPGERIWLVTPTTTWASPQALLAASDQRLLWLLDDAVNGRVQTLRFAAIEAASTRCAGRASVSRRSAFAPATAAASRSASCGRRPPPRWPAGSAAGQRRASARRPARSRRRRRMPPSTPGGASDRGSRSRARARSARPARPPASASAAIAHQPASYAPGPGRQARGWRRGSPRRARRRSGASSRSSRCRSRAATGRRRARRPRRSSRTRARPRCPQQRRRQPFGEERGLGPDLRRQPHAGDAALITAPGRMKRRGSTRSVKRPAMTAAAPLASGPGAIARPARSTE